MIDHGICRFIFRGLCTRTHYPPLLYMSHASRDLFFPSRSWTHHFPSAIFLHDTRLYGFILFMFPVACDQFNLPLSNYLPVRVYPVPPVCLFCSEFGFVRLPASPRVSGIAFHASIFSHSRLLTLRFVLVCFSSHLWDVTCKFCFSKCHDGPLHFVLGRKPCFSFVMADVH